jgi:hypothetical protein
VHRLSSHISPNHLQDYERLIALDGLRPLARVEDVWFFRYKKDLGAPSSRRGKRTDDLRLERIDAVKINQASLWRPRVDMATPSSCYAG